MIKKVPHQLIFVIGGLSLLTQCTSYQPVSPLHKRAKLVDLPAPSHTKEVEVYFQGERPQDTAFVKLEIVDVYGNDATSSTAMVNELKRAAQHRGLDALLLMDKQIYAELLQQGPTVGDLVVGLLTNPTPRVPDYSTKTTQTVSALGIKYIKHIDYLDQYPVSQHVMYYNPQTNEEKEALKIRLDSYGREKKHTVVNEKGAEYFNKYVEPYRYDYLVTSDFRWFEVRDKQNRVVKRKHRTETGEVDLRVKLYYDSLNRVKQLKLTYIDIPKTEVMELHYTGERLVAKNVFRDQQLVWKEELIYDEHNRLMEERIYWLEQESKNPFFRIRYTYCGSTDIDCFLHKE